MVIDCGLIRCDGLGVELWRRDTCGDQSEGVRKIHAVGVSCGKL